MPKIGSKPTGVDFKKSRMLRANTPLEDYRDRYGLMVKREDLSCPPPGPPFSKARGVYAHVKKRPEQVIGVLDTVHSQAGHAVARACQILGKKCVNFYPVYKSELDDNDPPQHELRIAQIAAQDLGAEIHGLTAGRSCILFHQARKLTEARGGYIMPNALKLDESVEETAKECRGLEEDYDTVIIPASSGTIAAGVVRGLGNVPKYVIHLGYSRSHSEIDGYIRERSGVRDARLVIVDEEYAYKDEARLGETPPWPCNVYYDLKAFRWWLSVRESYDESVLFWNIG